MAKLIKKIKRQFTQSSKSINIIYVFTLFVLCTLFLSRSAFYGLQNHSLVGPYYGQDKTPKKILTEKPEVHRTIASAPAGPNDIPERHSFLDLAYVNTSECSTDYSIIDNCYNYNNPPTPSLIRSWMVPVLESTDTAIYPSWGIQTNMSYILPHQRSSNDGRLSLYPNGYNMAISAFRPDNVNYDLKITSPAKPPLSAPQNIHPLTFFNPLQTTLSIPNTNNMYNDVPNAFHNTFCDDSSTGYDLTQDEQISNGRNPTQCEARYNSYDTYHSGDCYDITLVTDIDTTKYSDTPKWEIRSVDLTIFVPKGKDVTAADNIGYTPPAMWIYPRQKITRHLNDPIKKNTLRQLPDFQDYNLYANTYYTTALQSVGTSCYKTKKGSVVYPLTRKEGSPKWCEFFDHQSYSQNGFEVFNFDNPNGGYTHWSGEQCSDPTKDCGGHFLFEPSVTADGKLLVLNMFSSMVYSYNSVGTCKASGWNTFKPLGMMPYDPDINTRYAIGRNQISNGIIKPFRDSSGNNIPSYASTKGAYGWIDREGKNIFYAISNPKRDGYRALSYTGTPPSNEPDDVPFGQGGDLNPDTGPGKSVSVLGAWTQGKLVVLDNMLNFSDLGGRRTTNYLNKQMEYDMPFFDEHTTTLIRPQGIASLFSFENLFNFYDALSPSLPFDVVWKMSSNNQMNSEIAFDEYLLNNAFVVAHMNSPVDPATQTPKDGFVSNCTYFNQPACYKFTNNPILQNAATTDSFYSDSALVVPQELRLRGGARVEPMAHGGIEGKGVYLDGMNDFIDMGYPIPYNHNDWYYSLWIDSRETDPTKLRTVFTFPDGSKISLSLNELRFYNAKISDPAQRTKSISIAGLIQANQYFNLGIKIVKQEDSRIITPYINGTKLVRNGSTTITYPIENTSDYYSFGFQPYDNYLGNGWTWFVVGDPGFQGSNVSLKGWIDEFRMYNLSSNEIKPWFEEFICNEALGTLVDVSTHAGESASTKLDSLRQIAEDHGIDYAGVTLFNFGFGRSRVKPEVCEQMKLSSYTTPTDFPSQHGLGSICIDQFHRSPSTDDDLNSRCTRASRLNIKNKPLLAPSPRPDFSKVNFCLSCHKSDKKIPSLSPEALEFRNIPRYQDHRRQPLNAPATVYGNVPHGITWDNNPNIRAPAQSTCISDGKEDQCIPMDFIFDYNSKLRPY